MSNRQEEEYLKTLEQMFHDEPYLLSVMIHITPESAIHDSPSTDRSREI